MTDLGRFVEAQAPVIDQVRRELAAGLKQTHWMWFVFPQLRGLGRSETARFYGLDGLDDARAYLAHPLLGPRLVECTGLVNHVRERTALQVFGMPDVLKFQSCATLFAAIQAEPFEVALRTFYDGQPDLRTREMIHAA